MNYHIIPTLFIFSICLILLLILLKILSKAETKVVVLTVVILSSVMTGFIAGISQETAPSVLIPVISSFIAILLSLLFSKNSNQEDYRFNEIKVKYIGSLLTTFLMVLLVTYMYSNYLRFNCNDFLGLMGFGQDHCKDSMSKITFSQGQIPIPGLKIKNSDKPKMAQIRCKYMGTKLSGCEEFVIKDGDFHKLIDDKRKKLLKELQQKEGSPP